MHTFDITTLLILIGALQIREKLRTMAPISLHRQNSKL
ncbi:hypothetical protein ESCAB7627_2036 [Escherichia albertii TW07627]|uniref:Uncharacterized protein n=1 Tax=Escherichia albertii (strain TW07627) TaxID=502347 RepID=A0ABC9NKS3_ESCAT|nr:hypothetical protein ESCAB7627_2036 [Escherichia albertii TW07627]